jgi:hypothetical protein
VLLLHQLTSGDGVQAYGEVFLFQARLTRIIMLSFVLMVVSSLIAASSDISHVLEIANLRMPHAPDSLNAITQDPISGIDVGVADPLAAEKARIAELAGQGNAQAVLDGLGGWGVLNSGYVWMALNCAFSAAYVSPVWLQILARQLHADSSQVLIMRKRIKVTGFKDWDTMFYNNLLSVPVLILMSLVSSTPPPRCRRMLTRSSSSRTGAPRTFRATCERTSAIQSAVQLTHSQPAGDTAFALRSHHLLGRVCRLHLVHDGVVHPRHVVDDILDGRRAQQAAAGAQRHGLLPRPGDAGQHERHRRRLHRRVSAAAGGLGALSDPRPALSTHTARTGRQRPAASPRPPTSPACRQRTPRPTCCRCIAGKTRGPMPRAASSSCRA